MVRMACAERGHCDGSRSAAQPDRCPAKGGFQPLRLAHKITGLARVGKARTHAVKSEESSRVDPGRCCRTPKALAHKHKAAPYSGHGVQQPRRLLLVLTTSRRFQAGLACYAGRSHAVAAALGWRTQRRQRHSSAGLQIARPRALAAGKALYVHTTSQEA